MLNQSVSQENKQPIYTGPLSELREQIEAVTDQIVGPKPSPKELLHSIQHDLRTPIGNILACVTLMHMDGEMTDSQRELADIVEEAANTLIKKLDHLLSLT